MHNQTAVGTFFPISSVKIGIKTYGKLNITFFDNKNKSDMIIIGNYVSIADDVNFFLGENHQTNTITTFPLKTFLLKKSYSEDTVSKGSIIIEDEVWIGYGVRILSGVTIGKGAIIATGSVVINNVPPYTVVGGVPSKIIKQRFSVEITKRLLNLDLVNLPEIIIINNIDLFYKTIKTESDLNSIEELFKKENNDSNNKLL